MSNDNIVLGYSITLDLEPTDLDEFKVEIEKSSGGETKMNAIDNINRINFQYEEQDGYLKLSPNILIPTQDKFHGQEVEVTIYIPEGKTLDLGAHIHRIYFRDWSKCSNSGSERRCDGAVFTNDHGMISTVDRVKKKSENRDAEQ